MYAYKQSPYSSHAVILRWAGQGFGRRLLDVGSGPGHLAWRLGRREWKVTTLDRDGGFAEVPADLDTDRPSHIGLFDTIVCADVLEHLADPPAVLEWLQTRLLPEGRLLVSIPNIAHASTRLGLLAGFWTESERGLLDRTHRHFYTRATARALLEGAGFRILRQTATPAPVSLVVRGWPQPLERLHAGLARMWPSLFGYQSIFLCAKGRE